MKVILSTMGKSLEIFINMLDLVQQSIFIDRIGLYVSSSRFFKDFSKKHPFKQDDRIELLKEWEITGAGKIAKPDWERVYRYEQEIGDPTLWSALIADRRIFFGKYCKQKQDYVPKFNYEQMVGILDEALCKIDTFIKSIQPDIILGFSTATFGDYLFYLFARARKIPYLQLKSTKISNYVALHDTVFGLSSHIETLYFDQKDLPKEITLQAQQFLDSVAHKGLKYEGAILSGRSRMIKRLKSAPLSIIGGLYGAIEMSLDPVLRNDNHLPGNFIPRLYSNLFQPLKASIVESRLNRNPKYIGRKSLAEIEDFVFYPLHFEPEVSLQVLGRPYQNQIELVRNIAQNIPIGMKVIIKEHPRSLGFRAYPYYRKLLDIPNVFLIDPFIPAIEIVRYARLVAVVAGSIGFEAAICKKPVITFGKVTYNILPDNMVRHISDLNRLGYEIHDILNHYAHDYESLERYVGATIMGSVPVGLYTVLLNKGDRFSENSSELSYGERCVQDYKLLSLYCVKRINEVLYKS